MAFTAYIFEEDYKRLKGREVLHVSQQQKGGSLFGQWTSTGNPVIHRALSYSQSQDERDAVARSLYEGFRVCHIGEWRPVEAHTYNDMQARQSLRPAREERFLVLDVSRTDIVPFLLNPQTAQLGRLERLSGKNPFNKTESFDEPLTRRDYDYQARHAGGQPNFASQASRAAQFQEARTTGGQWYSGEEGNKKLKRVFKDIEEIALGNVNMSRDTVTQDISLSFTDNLRRSKWEIKFPSSFPARGALLIENPGTSEEKRQWQRKSDKASDAVKYVISCIQRGSLI